MIEKLSSLFGFFHFEVNYKRDNLSIKLILKIAIPIILLTFILKYFVF